MHGSQKRQKQHNKFTGYINSTKARIQWHKTHSLLFKEKPDYAFVLAENGKVQEIKAEYRRIANQIVEEAMIIANICAAQFYTNRQNRHFQHPQRF